MLKFAQLATSVKSRYRAADAVTVVAASEQQERTLPGGQGRRSTYDASIDAPAEAGDEIEGGWRREELLAMDIRRAPQARRDRLKHADASHLLRLLRTRRERPRGRRALRIFVVRCSLPCDPPVGGHPCNGGMIPRFQPLRVRGGT